MGIPHRALAAASKFLQCKSMVTLENRPIPHSQASGDRHHRLALHAVADLRGSLPYEPKFFLFSCTFWGNLANLYVGAPPSPKDWRPPPTGNPGSAPDMNLDADAAADVRCAYL